MPINAAYYCPFEKHNDVIFSNFWASATERASSLLVGVHSRLTLSLADTTDRCRPRRFAEGG